MDMSFSLSPRNRLGRLVQAGLVDKWHGDEVTKFKQSAVQRKEESQEGESNEDGGRVTVKPLMIEHLQVLKNILENLSHSLTYYNYFLLNFYITPITLNYNFLLTLSLSF